MNIKYPGWSGIPMTEEQIQKYEKWLDDNSSYDVILSAEILEDLKTLQQQNKQLIEVLEWYADHTNYHPYRFMSENGKRARTALQQIQGNK